MKIVRSGIAIAALVFIAACAGRDVGRGAPAEASPATDRGQASVALGAEKVTVEYGRPALAGRNIETMIRPGQEWRMGSNAATTLTTEADLKFGDAVVAKGEYVLKARLVSDQQWQLLIEKKDGTAVAQAPLSFQRVDSPVELMTIDLEKKGDGGRFILHWGTFTLSTDFEKA